MSQVDHFAALLLAAVVAEIDEIRRLIKSIVAILDGDNAPACTPNEQLQCVSFAIQRSDETAALLANMACGATVADAIRTIAQPLYRISFSPHLTAS